MKCVLISCLFWKFLYEVYIEKLQTPLGNSQTESNLLFLKEYIIGGSKPWNIPYDDYEYRGQLLSTASVTLYREVLDINYYLDVYNFRMPMPPRFLKSYPIFLTKFILLTCFWWLITEHWNDCIIFPTVF